MQSPLLKRLSSLLTITLIILLSGCFEIVEDVTIHTDGSGSFSYTVNMSQSKTRLDGMMKLDSSDGYRVPKKTEVEKEIQKAKESLEKAQGITNVTTSSDWINYIFTIKFDFNNINNLNLAVESLSADLSDDHKRIPEASDNFAFSGKTFDRKSHYDAKAMAKKITPQDKEIMKHALYTCIFRFDSPVKSCSNKDAVISKSGKNVMLKLNMLQLSNGQKSVINKITLQ